MEFTRELYWNVGRGPVAQLSMYALTFAVVAILLAGFWTRIRVYRTGRPVRRSDNMGRRLATACKNIFLQRKVWTGEGAGLAHSFFFWAFILLLAGTILIFIQSDITEPFLGYRFLKGPFYALFSLFLDLAGIVAIVALVALYLFRYWLRDGEGGFSSQAMLMHGLLLFILCSGFVVEGARIAATELDRNPGLSYWSPAGMAVALSLSGLSARTLRSLHLLLWWVHFAAAAAFIAIIPFTRLRHMFTTGANYVVTVLEPPGSLADLDLESSAEMTYGAATARDLAWKDLLDSDACTDCKRCQDRCPAFLTEKPLSPMKMVSRINEAAFKGGGNLLEMVTPEAIWSCTTCRACQHICPADIEHVSKIVEMRRNLVLMTATVAPEMTQLFRNLEFYGDPSAMGPARRTEWADGLGIREAAVSDEPSLLYWVGCAGAFDERYREVAKALVSILRSAGVSFSILGGKEHCCGDFARRMGNEYLYQDLAQKNLETFKKFNVRKIITSCPHCYNVLKNEYPSLGSSIEVVHHSDYILGLLKEGKLQLTRPLEKTVTYHDPCYLGRYNGTYLPPREILHRIEGVTLAEPECSRQESFCCGAGGGFMWLPEQGKRINEARAEQLMAAGPEIIATACPYCLCMLEEGAATKAEELGRVVQTLDVAEIVAKQL